jgi:GMP synthase PP-ATPase subunit
VTPTPQPFDVLERLANGTVKKVPGVGSVTYNMTLKPPSRIEAV